MAFHFFHPDSSISLICEFVTEIGMSAGGRYGLRERPHPPIASLEISFASETAKGHRCLQNLSRRPLSNSAKGPAMAYQPPQQIRPNDPPTPPHTRTPLPSHNRDHTSTLLFWSNRRLPTRRRQTPSPYALQCGWGCGGNLHGSIRPPSTSMCLMRLVLRHHVLGLRFGCSTATAVGELMWWLLGLWAARIVLALEPWIA
ncbi:hypothetical protein HDK64DRAFT_87638 [Phyllosticta capitalensis]